MIFFIAYEYNNYVDSESTMPTVYNKNLSSENEHETNASKKFSEEYESMLKEMFLVTPFGLKCKLCEKPLPKQAVTVVNKSTFVSHIKYHHQKINTFM